MSKSKDKGILVRWMLGRGYGFVITTTGDEIFAHESEFMDLKTVGPPEIGQYLRFSIITDRGKRRMVRAVRSKEEFNVGYGSTLAPTRHHRAISESGA